MRTKLLLLLFITCCLRIDLSAQTVSATVFFETASSELSSSENSKLQLFIKNLDTLVVSKISVSAYCDDIGQEAYNKALSLKRAEHMNSLLSSIMRGVTIQTEGKGEVALKENQETADQRSTNRRADIMVSYSLKQKPALKQTVTETPVSSDQQKAVEEFTPILSDNQKAGDKIILKNILFVGGRHTLLPESYEALEQLTKVVLEKKKYHIRILGHICCVYDGNDGIDFDTGITNLSVARAMAIYNYLVKQGVSPDRLSYKGLKANYPTGLGDKEDRRVEIEITKVTSD